MPAFDWLDANWQYAGAVAGLFYLLLLPLMGKRWQPADLLLWLQLPIYIAHQLEEHVHDRFRRWMNSQIGHGLPVLTPRAVTVINIGGVWCVDLVAVYLAKFAGPGWASFAFYLAIINASVHIAGAIATRAYNPGLVTSVVLLLPFGIWGAVTYSATYKVSVSDDVSAIVCVVAFHAAMVAYFLRRRAALAQCAREVGGR